MSNLTNISGGRQLAELLKTLAPNVQKKILRTALAAGARVIAKVAKQNAPVGRRPRPAKRFTAVTPAH